MYFCYFNFRYDTRFISYIIINKPFFSCIPKIISSMIFRFIYFWDDTRFMSFLNEYRRSFLFLHQVKNSHLKMNYETHVMLYNK